MIAGCQIKNRGKGGVGWATRGFKISGSKKETDPWEILVEDELIDTTGGKPVSLLNFPFKEPVEIQFIKFELVSYWGPNGGGLQYFAAIPGEATTGTNVLPYLSVIIITALLCSTLVAIVYLVVRSGSDSLLEVTPGPQDPILCVINLSQKLDNGQNDKNMSTAQYLSRIRNTRSNLTLA